MAGTTTDPGLASNYIFGRVLIYPSHEDQGPIYPSNEAGIGSLEGVVGDGREDEADPEEVKLGGRDVSAARVRVRQGSGFTTYKARVDLPDGPEPGRADETPNDGRRVDSLAVGAGEAIGLVVVADAVHVAQHPQRRADLCQGAQDRGQALGKE